MSKNNSQWYWGGVLLAAAFFLAILFVKPIGVSTQFVVADGIIWRLFEPDIIVKNLSVESGYSSPNAFFNANGGKIAAAIANPINYGFVFVLSMMAGSFLSSIFGGNKPSGNSEKEMPEVWRKKIGDSAKKRYIWAFLSGFIVLIGARLAGGCTSGNMMSGMMQTALSGYIFSLGVFLTALPLAYFIFKERK